VVRAHGRERASESMYVDVCVGIACAAWPCQGREVISRLCLATTVQVQTRATSAAMRKPKREQLWKSDDESESDASDDSSFDAYSDDRSSDEDKFADL
jgi:hypothetical protein